MANVRDEDLFSSDFDSDFDYDDATTLPLRANFDLAGVVHVPDENGDSSRSSSPASDREVMMMAATTWMLMLAVNLILNLKNIHILLPAHLQFVFEELDIETSRI